MRLIVTGGGTGGHIYPALEVARLARTRGFDVHYFGSLRGQESRLCADQGVPFIGFGSAPLYSLREPRGWQSVGRLALASLRAHGELSRHRPDVVFSTGGYSAAPVLFAARTKRIPSVLLESNSVPGRTTRMFIPNASAMAYVFQHTERFDTTGRGVRTGQPVRDALRLAAVRRQESAIPTVVVVGGSQGSAYLNDAVPRAAMALPKVRFIHATGRANFESVAAKVAPLELGDRYRLVPYLEQAELMEAYQTAAVAVGRSGGTVAEFAVFGLPSVLVPLPQSADDHQRVNAQEFADMHAATIAPQSASTPSNADVETLAVRIGQWIEDRAGRARAAEALRGWDVPDATERIVRLIEEAKR